MNRMTVRALLLAAALCAVPAAASAQGTAPGAKRLWGVEKRDGVVWLSCVHKSCGAESLVSYKRLGPAGEPATDAVLRQQMELFEDGRMKSGQPRESLSVSKPSRQRLAGGVAVVMSGVMPDREGKTVYIRRGMLYRGGEAISLVSTARSPGLANTNFRFVAEKVIAADVAP